MTNYKKILQDLEIQANAKKTTCLEFVCKFENGSIETDLGTYIDIEKAIEDLKIHNKSKGYESSIQIIDVVDNKPKVQQEIFND